MNSTYKKKHKKLRICWVCKEQNFEDNMVWVKFGKKRDEWGIECCKKCRHKVKKEDYGVMNE